MDELLELDLPARAVRLGELARADPELHAIVSLLLKGAETVDAHQIEALMVEGGAAVTSAGAECGSFDM